MEVCAIPAWSALWSASGASASPPPVAVVQPAPQDRGDWGESFAQLPPYTAQCPSKDPAYITRSDQSRLKKSPGRFSLIGRQELFEDAWPTSVAPCKEVEPARHRPLVILVQLEQVGQPTHWRGGGQEAWPSQQPLFTGSNLFYKLLSTYTLRPKMKREKTFEQWQDHLEGNE